VRQRAPPPSSLDNLGVRALRLPPAVEWGAPLVAEVELFHAPGAQPVTRAWLDFEVEGSAGAGGAERRTLEVSLAGAAGARSLAVELGLAEAGRTEVRVRARLDGGSDPIPEDDRAEAATRASGVLVAALLADPEGAEAARAWLAPGGACQLSGLQVLFRAPEEAAALLAELDLVVSFDLPPARLPQGPLEAFVRGGGGWLATGGWRFLEAWASARPAGRLDALLPVEPAPSALEPRDVVLLVDGSGSMEGEPFARVREACRELVAFARPEDEVALRFFTSRLEPALLLKPRATQAPPGGAAAARLEALFNLRVPRGDTEILTSLEALARERAKASAAALVFLLSDGREREAGPDPAARIAALEEALAASRARLRVIAIGKDADASFLRLLARPGEDIDRPQDLSDLEAIFQREMSGALHREGSLQPASVAAAAGSLVASIFPGEAPALPPLTRMLRLRPRPAAEVAWQVDESPLLVVARVGLGRVACFATSPARGWGTAWAGRSGLGEPAEMGPLLRWLARGPARARAGPRLTRAGSTLCLEGAADLPPSFAAELLDDDLASRAPRVELAFALSPGHAGRDPREEREARIAEDVAPATGGYVRIPRPSGEPLVLALPAVLDPEFDPDAPRLGLQDFEPPAMANGFAAMARGAGGLRAASGVLPLLAGAVLAGLAGALLVARGLRRQATGRSFR
jgi:hypothetical protein